MKFAHYEGYAESPYKGTFVLSTQLNSSIRITGIDTLGLDIRWGDRVWTVIGYSGTYDDDNAYRACTVAVGYSEYDIHATISRLGMINEIYLDSHAGWNIETGWFLIDIWDCLLNHRQLLAESKQVINMCADRKPPKRANMGKGFITVEGSDPALSAARTSINILDPLPVLDGERRRQGPRLALSKCW